MSARSCRCAHQPANRGRLVEPLYYFKTLAVFEAVDVEVAYVYREDGAATYLVREPDNCGVGKIRIKLCVAGKYDGDISVGFGREFRYTAAAPGKPRRTPSPAPPQ